MTIENNILTTFLEQNGKTTIPEPLREEMDLSEGDELRWEMTDNGPVLQKTTNAAGRGMLVDDDTSAAEREALAEALEDTIRENRKKAWRPD